MVVLSQICQKKFCVAVARNRLSDITLYQFARIWQIEIGCYSYHIGIILLKQHIGVASIKRGRTITRLVFVGHCSANGLYGKVNGQSHILQSQ